MQSVQYVAQTLNGAVGHAGQAEGRRVGGGGSAARSHGCGHTAPHGLEGSEPHVLPMGPGPQQVLPCMQPCKQLINHSSKQAHTCTIVLGAEVRPVGPGLNRCCPFRCQPLTHSLTHSLSALFWVHPLMHAYVNSLAYGSQRALALSKC